MSTMAELDAAIRGASTVSETAAHWLDRQRRAITENAPVTLTLGFADVDRLATILCAIESGCEVEPSDDITRLFEAMCAATDSALGSGANARSVF